MVWENIPGRRRFSIIIDIESENQAEMFKKNMWEYADDFDVDDHIEMWMPKRGSGIFIIARYQWR